MCRTASFRNGVTSSPNHSLFHVPATSTMVKRPRTCIYTRCAHRPVPFRPRTLASHPPAPDSAPRRPPFAPSRPQPGHRPLYGYTARPPTAPADFRPQIWDCTYSLGRKRNNGDGSSSQTGMRVTPRHKGSGYNSLLNGGGNRPYETMGCQVGRSPEA